MGVLGRFLSKLGFPAFQSRIDAASTAQAAATALCPPAPVWPSTPSHTIISGGGRPTRRIKKKAAVSTPASGGVVKKKAVRASPVHKKSKRRKKSAKAQVPQSEETLAKRRAAVEKRKKTIAAKPKLDKEHVEIVSVWINPPRMRMMNCTSGRVVAVNSLEHQMALKAPSATGGRGHWHQYIRKVYLPAATGDLKQSRTEEAQRQCCTQ